MGYIPRIINPNEIKDHRILDDFNDYLIKNDIITETYEGVGQIRYLKIENNGDISNNCFFMLLGRILSQDSSKDEFINACLISVSNVNEPYSLETFDLYPCIFQSAT